MRQDRTKGRGLPLAVPQGKEDETIDAYLRVAQTWAEDKATRAEQSERRAWWVAKGGFGLAALLVVAIMLMLPLKQTITEVLVVDKSNGNVEQMTSLEEAKVKLEDYWIKNHITKFMLAREGYNPTMNEKNYYDAAAFLSPPLQDEWNKMWAPENPNNLIKKYGQDKFKRVDISSIVINKNDDGTKNTATIRYSTTVIQNGYPQPADYRIANMAYGYTEVSKSEKERWVNPVGWQITAYQTDPEVGGKPEVPAMQ